MTCEFRWPRMYMREMERGEKPKGRSRVRWIREVVEIRAEEWIGVMKGRSRRWWRGVVVSRPNNTENIRGYDDDDV